MRAWFASRTGLGLNYLYFPSGIHPQARQEYGTAILSPWPIESPVETPAAVRRGVHGHAPSRHRGHDSVAGSPGAGVFGPPPRANGRQRRTSGGNRSPSSSTPHAGTPGR